MLRRVGGYDSALSAAVMAIIAGSIYLLLTAIVLPSGAIDHSFGERQVVFAIIGIGGAVAVSRVNLELLERAWLPIYLAGLGSIAVLYLLGTAIRGSRRWIELGPVNVQPSEFGKVLVLLGVAGFISTRTRDAREPWMFASVLGLVAVPALLVFKQPDFGTSQIYGYIALALLFFAGARWTHFAVLFGTFGAVLVLVLALLPAVGIEVLHDFQKQRIVGFLDPESDPRGSNYQAIQAKIAIGSGQLLGKPADEASQVKQAFLPEPQTDFIFATLAERHGFVGGALVLLVYLLLVSRCLQAVAVAPTYYGRLVCGGITMMFASQVITNVGMVIGLMPITGVPLPMFSYGGSGMLASLGAIGLVAGVLRDAERAEVRYARRVGPGLAAARMGALRERSRSDQRRSQRSRARRMLSR